MAARKMGIRKMGTTNSNQFGSEELYLIPSLHTIFARLMWMSTSWKENLLGRDMIAFYEQMSLWINHYFKPIFFSILCIAFSLITITVMFRFPETLLLRERSLLLRGFSSSINKYCKYYRLISQFLGGEKINKMKSFSVSSPIRDQ